MKRFMRFSNEKNIHSCKVKVYNKRYDFICTVDKEYLRGMLTFPQLEKFNKLNFDETIDEICLIVEEF